MDNDLMLISGWGKEEKEMNDKLTVPGTMPTLIADLTCAANGSYTENYIRALCERAAEALSLESVRSEALWVPVEPTREMERAGMLRSQESDIFNGVRAITFADCAKIYRAMIAVAPLQQPEEPQSPVRVAEALDTKMADLLIDATWRKCVGQCVADNCGRLFISRERFDEHIAPLIRVHSTELRK